MKTRRRHMMHGGMFAIALFVVGPLLGQEAKQGDEGTMTKAVAWEWLNRFIGEWEGTGRGTPGESKLTAGFEVILQGQYVCGVSKSVFPVQEKNPKGEVHEDWAIFSYDAARKTIVMRQFNSEGFVNRFVLKSLKDNGETFVFISEASENGPPKMKARMTYRFTGSDQFSEFLELAFDGVNYSPCVETSLRRTK